MSIQNFKKIGLIDNTFKGVESTFNQTSHLLIGIFGFLPAYCVSLRLSIIFLLSFILEIPAGIIADIIGHKKSVSFGCFFLSIASFFLMMSIICDNNIAIGMIIISSIFSSIGLALNSGAFQAMLQDLVDDYVNAANNDSNNLRIKTLSLSQKYGKNIAAFLPLCSICLLYVFFALSQKVHFIMLIPILLYFILGFYIFNISKIEHGSNLSITQRITTGWIDYRKQSLEFISYFKIANSNIKKLIFCSGLLTILTVLQMLHVHTYLMVSSLREYDFDSITSTQLISVIIFTFSFDFAHYIKGLAVPFLTEKFSPPTLMLISFASVIMLSMQTLLLYSYDYKFLALFIFILLFRTALTLSQNIVQSTLQMHLPKNIRATILSIAQMIILSVYGLYSVYLTISGEGTNSVQITLLQLIFLSLICLFITGLMRKPSARVTENVY